jgi:hypothetical protein
MLVEKLIRILLAFSKKSEVLIDIGERYAEIKDVKMEYSQRVDERKPYVIITIYKE